MRMASFYRFVPVSLVLIWLTLAASLAQAAEANQPLTPAEQSFLTRARSDNATQIAMAKLALSKSSNPRVIELANTIIQERSALDAQLVQLVDSKQAQQPAVDIASVERLQALDGKTFDRTFASAAVRNHCRTISAYEAVKLNASTPALKDLTHDAIPALRGSLTVALSVLRSSGPTPMRHQEALAAADPHATKTPKFWEPISLVAAPW